MKAGVEWRTVDYGQAVFHIASYSSEAAELPVEPNRLVETPKDEPCRMANCLPLYRCWTSARARQAA